MIINAKYPGKCAVCFGPIKVGDQIEWKAGYKLTKHAACANTAPAPSRNYDSSGDDAEAEFYRRERERDESEYQAGLADGRRRSAERKIYGEELAEQFEAEDEMNRWLRGEDD